MPLGRDYVLIIGHSKGRKTTKRTMWFIDLKTAVKRLELSHL